MKTRNVTSDGVYALQTLFEEHTVQHRLQISVHATRWRRDDSKIEDTPLQMGYTRFPEDTQGYLHEDFALRLIHCAEIVLYYES
jgi:hypothetical protein